MKKIIFSLLAILASLTANAQYVKLYKNGELVKEYSSTDIDEVVFEKEPSTYTINGVEYPMPEAVDFGLPSGTKWANAFVGKDKIFGFNNLTPYFFSNIDDCEFSDKYAPVGSDNIPSTYLGGKWNYPTPEQAKELLEYCTLNIDGSRFTITRNGITISLPFFVIIGEDCSWSKGSFWLSEGSIFNVVLYSYYDYGDDTTSDRTTIGSISNNVNGFGFVLPVYK